MVFDFIIEKSEIYNVAEFRNKFHGLFLQQTFVFFTFPYNEMIKLVGIVRIHNAG